MLDFLNLGLANKDFIITIITLGIVLVIVMPLVYYIIKMLEKSIVKSINDLSKTFKNTFDAHQEAEKELNDCIYNKILELDKETKKQNIELQQKMGNTVLNCEQTISLLQEKMWYVSSYGKLDAIKQILIINHIAGRRTEITEKVKNELTRYSERYIKDFKDFITPIGDLSQWLDKNFSEKDFENFVEQIVDIMYSDSYKKRNEKMTTEEIVMNKVNDVAVLMKTLQLNLAKKLRKDLEDFTM